MTQHACSIRGHPVRLASSLYSGALWLAKWSVISLGRAEEAFEGPGQPPFAFCTIAVTRLKSVYKSVVGSSWLQLQEKFQSGNQTGREARPVWVQLCCCWYVPVFTFLICCTRCRTRTSWSTSTSPDALRQSGWYSPPVEWSSRTAGSSKQSGERWNRVSLKISRSSLNQFYILFHNLLTD